MSQLEPLIADLALLLICAGVMTLLFKSLKQPIVLGYIVAGFLASPNMTYMPSITDGHGIHVWSEIGVIYLLFALGLEFSFKKILKMGAAPIIAAIAIIIGMMYVGSLAGGIFGWSDMDCLYLGGMLAMSSTTIIFKAFDDMKLRLLWKMEFRRFILIMIINSVLCLAVIAIMYYYGAPVIYGLLPEPWSGVVTAFVTLSISGPFLWALMRRGANSDNVNRLWNEGRRVERIKISAFGILRLAIGAAFIAYIIGNTLPKSGLLGIFAVIAIAFYIFLSPRMEKRSNRLTQTFTENLNEKNN